MAREPNRAGRAYVKTRVGAWALEAVFVLGRLSRLAAEATGGDPAIVLARTLQQTSVTVRRATARALLRRLASC